MSTFKRILAEKTRRDYGRKGGPGGTQSTSNTPLNKRESRANMQDPNRSQRGGRPNPVRGRKTPVSIPTKSGDLITNFAADANVPPEEQYQRLLDKATKDAKGERVGQQATHPVDKAAAKKRGEELTGGRVKGDREVGAQKTRTRFVKGQGFTIPTLGKPAERIPGGTGTKTGSLSKGTLKFSGDTKYKRMLRRLTTDAKPLPPGTGVKKSKGVSQAEVSAKQQEFRDKFQRSQTTSGKKFAPGSSGRVSTNKNIQDLIDKIPEKSKTKVTGGTPRVTDLAPTKRPAGTKTFARFAKSGRTAQQKQATLKALQTPPKTVGQPKVTAMPKPKAPTRAAVAPKVSKLKVAKGVAGGALSALGTAYSGYEGYSDAKKAGASDTRAWLRGAARAAGGLIGGTIGGAGGIVGGIAGYSIGSALADKTFTALAGATKGQKDWMKQANLASQKGTAVNKVKYKKGTQAVIYDPRTKKERIGTFDPTSKTYKAANLATSKAYTTKNPLERLGRQFSRSNEGSGLFGYGIVKGGALADKLKGYYAAQDEKARAKRVSDFKKAASAK